jgi:fucose permease
MATQGHPDLADPGSSKMRRPPQPRGEYRRDAVTWTAFGALFAFGFLNAVLGPCLPYLRAIERISYLAGVLHQVAYAVGGGLAGLLAAADRRRSLSRQATIVLGLGGAALAGLAVGYGDTLAITLLGALLMSLFGTSALIRVWAVLADVHGTRRAVAMSEGEVSVSLAGIFTPLLISGLAATALSWRFAFVVGGLGTIAAAVAVAQVGMPPTPNRSHDRRPGDLRAHRRWMQPTLIVIFAIVGLEFSLSFWLASYLNDDIAVARNTAVAMVSGLYAANLVGRLLVSRLARRISAARLLAGALFTALAGLPILLAATTAEAAAVGIALVGLGTGASFPLASSLHVEVTPGTADSALGQVLTVAAIGQIVAPLSAGAIAQAASLRIGLLVLPLLVVVAAAALFAYRHESQVQTLS